MNSQRKGVTPAVATVILLTISIAATASAYTFLTSTQSGLVEQFQNQLLQQETEQQSSMNIEFVYQGSDGYSLIDVRNTGSNSLVVDEGDRKNFRMFSNGEPVESSVGDSGEGWKYIDEGPDGSFILDPEEVLTMNSTVKYPDEDESMSFELTGPHETRSSHVCFNDGSSSC